MIFTEIRFSKGIAIWFYSVNWQWIVLINFHMKGDLWHNISSNHVLAHT